LHAAAVVLKWKLVVRNNSTSVPRNVRGNKQLDISGERREAKHWKAKTVMLISFDKVWIVIKGTNEARKKQ